MTNFSLRSCPTWYPFRVFLPYGTRPVACGLLSDWQWGWPSGVLAMRIPASSEIFIFDFLQHVHCVVFMFMTCASVRGPGQI